MPQKTLPASPVAFEVKLTPLTPEAALSPAADATPQPVKVDAAPPIRISETAASGTPSEGSPRPETVGGGTSSQNSEERPSAHPAQTIAQAIAPEPAAMPELSPAPTPVLEPVKSKPVRGSAPTQAQPEAAPVATAGPSPIIVRSVELRTASVSAPQHTTLAPPPSAVVAMALRESEQIQTAAAPLESAPRAAAAQNIELRIARPDAPTVELHVTDRAGQIRVDVRTPDAALQSSLREDLGTLVHSLERSGYRTEVFVPKNSVPAAPALTDLNFQSGSGRESTPRLLGPDQANDQASEQGRADTGGRRQQQQEQQQQPRHQRAANWIRTLENTL